jgi:hypothetical protein
MAATSVQNIYWSIQIIWIHYVRPVRIRVLTNPIAPLHIVCRKMWLNGAAFWMRSEKLRSRVTAGVAQ